MNCLVHISIAADVHKLPTSAMESEPPKTAKQLEKEAIKAAKLAKLAEKEKKKAEQTSAPKKEAQVSLSDDMDNR